MDVGNINNSDLTNELLKGQDAMLKKFQNDMSKNYENAGEEIVSGIPRGMKRGAKRAVQDAGNELKELLKNIEGEISRDERGIEISVPTKFKFNFDAKRIKKELDGQIKKIFSNQSQLVKGLVLNKDIFSHDFQYLSSQSFMPKISDNSKNDAAKYFSEIANGLSLSEAELKKSLPLYQQFKEIIKGIHVLKANSSLSFKNKKGSENIDYTINDSTFNSLLNIKNLDVNSIQKKIDLMDNLYRSYELLLNNFDSLPEEFRNKWVSEQPGISSSIEQFRKEFDSISKAYDKLKTKIVDIGVKELKNLFGGIDNDTNVAERLDKFKKEQNEKIKIYDNVTRAAKQAAAAEKKEYSKMQRYMTREKNGETIQNTPEYLQMRLMKNTVYNVNTDPKQMVNSLNQLQLKNFVDMFATYSAMGGGSKIDELQDYLNRCIKINDQLKESSVSWFDIEKRVEEVKAVVASILNGTADPNGPSPLSPTGGEDQFEKAKQASEAAAEQATKTEEAMNKSAEATKKDTEAKNENAKASTEQAQASEQATQANREQAETIDEVADKQKESTEAIAEGAEKQAQAAEQAAQSTERQAEAQKEQAEATQETAKATQTEESIIENTTDAVEQAVKAESDLADAKNKVAEASENNNKKQSETESYYNRLLKTEMKYQDLLFKKNTTNKMTDKQRAQFLQLDSSRSNIKNALSKSYTGDLSELSAEEKKILDYLKTHVDEQNKLVKASDDYAKNLKAAREENEKLAKNGKFGALKFTVTDGEDPYAKMVAHIRSVNKEVVEMGDLQKNAASKIQTMTVKVKDQNGQLKTITYTYDEVGKAVYELEKKSEKSISGISKFLSGLKGKWQEVAKYFLSFGSIYQVFNIIRQGVQYVVDVDTAMTELAKVSDATGQRLQQSFKNSAESAKELGATISDTISATADWSRQGYGIADSEELARVALLYQNIGDGIDVATANESLISTMQGFQLEADKSSEIIDKFNEVSNNFAISSAGIGESLQRSAASFYAANTDLSEAIALITGTNAVVQDPDSVGKTFAYPCSNVWIIKVAI